MWDEFGSGLWDGVWRDSHALFDLWAFGHVLVGFVQGYCLGFLGFCINVLLHVAFEIVENMYPKRFGIPERWGAPEYKGDTVLNSIGDLIAFAVGFALWNMYRVSGLRRVSTGSP
jgi:hypothetical protein